MDRGKSIADNTWSIGKRRKALKKFYPKYVLVFFISEILNKTLIFAAVASQVYKCVKTYNDIWYLGFFFLVVHKKCSKGEETVETSKQLSSGEPV